MVSADRCPKCRAPLAAWEGGRCACDGPRSLTNRDVLYAVACSAPSPLHGRDFVRLAAVDHGQRLDAATAFATLAPDPRFCWGGKGVYGLYRHGLPPGPRNLEEAARVILVAADEPLYPEVVDYCLKQLGYRYIFASLVNAVLRSARIERNGWGFWDHPRGETAERLLRSEIPLVPPRQRGEWIALRDAIGRRVKRAIANRAERIHAAGDLTRFGIDWS